jgi:hypothetical protein
MPFQQSLKGGSRVKIDWLKTPDIARWIFKEICSAFLQELPSANKVDRYWHFAPNISTTKMIDLAGNIVYT